MGSLICDRLEDALKRMQPGDREQRNREAIRFIESSRISESFTAVESIKSQLAENDYDALETPPDSLHRGPKSNDIFSSF